MPRLLRVIAIGLLSLAVVDTQSSQIRKDGTAIFENPSGYQVIQRGAVAQ